MCGYLVQATIEDILHMAGLLNIKIFVFCGLTKTQVMPTVSHEQHKAVSISW